VAKHIPVAFVIKGWSAPDFQYKFETITYCGPDAEKKFVEVLRKISKTVKTEIIGHMFTKYKHELSVAEEKFCNCNNQEEHIRGCKWRDIRNKVILGYGRIPILCFNSGKYDMNDSLSGIWKAKK